MTFGPCLSVTRSPCSWVWKLTGDQSGHLTKTVVTGVTEHEGPTYYHHAHVYDGSYEDGTASCRAKKRVPWFYTKSWLRVVDCGVETKKKNTPNPNALGFHLRIQTWIILDYPVHRSGHCNMEMIWRWYGDDQAWSLEEPRFWDTWFPRPGFPARIPEVIHHGGTSAICHIQRLYFLFGSY